MSMDRYIKSRPLIETADLLQWRSKGVIGAAIRWFSKIRYFGSPALIEDVNHSGGAIRFDRYSNGVDRRWTLEAINGGIDLNLISRQLEGYEGVLYLHKLKEAYSPFRDLIAGNLLCRKGTKYDFGNLFKQMFAAASVDAREFFCSEAVYWAGLEAGLAPAAGWPVKRAPKPAEMLNIGWWEEGSILLYDSDEKEK